MAISIIFFGTPEFAVPSLEALLALPHCRVRLVVTQPDKPAGRGNKLRCSNIKQVALQHALPVLQPDNIRRAEDDFLAAAGRYGPFDIGVVVAFGQILPVAVLALPRHGCINVHASLLPRWRGAAPIQRAIWHGDSETGVCLMQMDAGLDSGPLLACAKVPINEAITFGELHDELATLGANLLKENIIPLVEGKLTPVPQAKEGLTYANKISAQETLIDWSPAAVQIARQVRALSPFPGAYCLFNGQRLRIFRAQPKSLIGPESGLAPGTVSTVDKDRLEVKCGSGVLALTEVQLEGRKRLNIVDFLRGCPIAVGTLLTEQSQGRS